MGLYEPYTRAQQETDRQLSAAREAFPYWRIVELAGGGFLAVHAETVMLESLTVDGLVAQLRQQ